MRERLRQLIASPPATGRNPDTVFLLALLLAVGVGQLATGAESGTVDALVPRPVLYGWSITLTTGAGVTLAGVLWPAHVTGLLIESVGRVMLAPAAFAYALALAAVAGLGGAFPAGLLLGLTISSTVRLWQIWAEIHRLRSTMSDISERQGTGR